jgi:hypothetical protein
MTLVGAPPATNVTQNDCATAILPIFKLSSLISDSQGSPGFAGGFGLGKGGTKGGF